MSQPKKKAVHFTCRIYDENTRLNQFRKTSFHKQKQCFSYFLCSMMPKSKISQGRYSPEQEKSRYSPEKEKRSRHTEIKSKEESSNRPSHGTASLFAKTGQLLGMPLIEHHCSIMRTVRILHNSKEMEDMHSRTKLNPFLTLDNKKRTRIQLLIKFKGCT